MGTCVSRHRDQGPAPLRDTGVSIYVIPSYKNYRVHHHGLGATRLVAKFAKQVPFFHQHRRLHPYYDRYSRQVSLDDEDISLIVIDDGGRDLEVKGFTLHAALRSGVMFVYDITRRETWEDCKMMMEDRIGGFCLQNRARQEEIRKRVMIVGCKCDLVKEREVEYAAVKKYADENGLLFIETSAKDGINVDYAFVSFAAHLFEVRHAQRSNP